MQKQGLQATMAPLFYSRTVHWAVQHYVEASNTFNANTSAGWEACEPLRAVAHYNLNQMSGLRIYRHHVQIKYFWTLTP